MAVTKRTRFEVLRRDNHTCRYCRSDENALTIDHVVPVALGGSDDPSNLVAACRDCNAGKSSAAPDASLVADVQEDALRHSEMIRQAYAVMVEQLRDKEEYLDLFIDAWPWDRIYSGWRGSIAKFWRMGVPIELIADAIERTDSRPAVVTVEAKFKYMCGILWNQIHVVTDEVSLRDALSGAWMTENDQLDKSYEDFNIGLSAGISQEPYGRMLQYVCDGRALRANLEDRRFDRERAA